MSSFINNVSKSYEELVFSFKQLVLKDHKPDFVEFIADCVTCRETPSVDLNEKADLFLYSAQDDSEPPFKIASQITLFGAKDPSQMIAMAFQMCLFFSLSDEEAYDAFTMLQPELQKRDPKPDALHELARLILEVRVPFSQLSSFLQITAFVHSPGTFCGWNVLDIEEFSLFFPSSLSRLRVQLERYQTDALFPLYEMILPKVSAIKTLHSYPAASITCIREMLESPFPVVRYIGLSLLSTSTFENEGDTELYRRYLPRVLADGLLDEATVAPAFHILEISAINGEQEAATSLYHALLTRYRVSEIVQRADLSKTFLVSIAGDNVDTLHYLVDKRLSLEQEDELREHLPKLMQRDDFQDDCLQDTNFGIYLLKKGAQASLIKEVVSLKPRNLNSCYELITHKRFAPLFAEDPEYLFWVYISYCDVRSNSIEHRLKLLQMAFKVAFEVDAEPVYRKLAESIRECPIELDLFPLIAKLREHNLSKAAVDFAPSLEGHCEEALCWCEELLRKEQFQDLETVFRAARISFCYQPLRQARIVFALAKQGRCLEQMHNLDLRGDSSLFYECLDFALEISSKELLKHFLEEIPKHLPANLAILKRAASTSCRLFHPDELTERLFSNILLCMPEDHEVLSLSTHLRTTPVRLSLLLISKESPVLKAKACELFLEGIKTEDIAKISESDLLEFVSCGPYKEKILEAVKGATPPLFYFKLLIATLQKMQNADDFVIVKKLLSEAVARRKAPSQEALSYARECLKLFFSWSPSFASPLLLEQCKMLQSIKNLIGRRQAILEDYIGPQFYDKITNACFSSGVDPKVSGPSNPLTDFLSACEREHCFEGNFELYSELHLFCFGELPGHSGRTMTELRVLEKSSIIVFSLLHRLALDQRLIKRFADILCSHHACLDKNQLTKCCTLIKTTIKAMPGRSKVQIELLATIDTIPSEASRANIRKQIEQRL